MARRIPVRVKVSYRVTTRVRTTIRYRYTVQQVATRLVQEARLRGNDLRSESVQNWLFTAAAAETADPQEREELKEAIHDLCEADADE